MFEGVKEFADQLDRGAPGNLTWEYRSYQGNNHFTNAVETWFDDLKLYFQSMR